MALISSFLGKVDLPYRSRSHSARFAMLGVGLAYALIHSSYLSTDASRGTDAGQVMPGLSVGIGTTLASFVPTYGAQNRRRGGALAGLGRQQTPVPGRRPRAP